MYLTSRFITLSFLVLYVIITIPNTVSGQENVYQKEDILSFANTVYGPDDRLINGKYYKPKHFSAQGHPYFLSENWLKGTLFVKGIEYNNIPIKYNIEDDILIINVIFQNRVSKNILLHNSFVDSVEINSPAMNITSTFHNTSNFSNENSIGYAEIVYKGRLSAYYKHTREFIDEINYYNKYGRYLNPKRKLFLFNVDNFQAITTKKGILNYFPAHKKEVKLFIRKNKIRFSKITVDQIVNLIRFCEQL